MKKSTASLLIPQVREKVEKRIRKDYPDGIPAVGADALRFTFAALATYGRTINFDLKRADGYKQFLQQAVECGAVRADERRPHREPADHCGRGIRPPKRSAGS